MDHGSEMLHLLQALPCAPADEVVFTNKQQLAVMLEDLHDEHLAGSTSDSCCIGYFGTLCANRGIGTIIEAVRFLDPTVRQRFRIDIHTSQVTQGRDLIARNGVSDVFHFRARTLVQRISHQGQPYNHLLVTDTQTGGFSVANPFMPSKVSDYQATGITSWLRGAGK